MAQVALHRAFTSVFNPLFLFYSIHFISHTNPVMHAHMLDQWCYRRSPRDDEYHHSLICIRVPFPHSNGAPLTNRHLTDPHHIYHDATTLTMITTNSSQKSPQQPMPDFFTTNATTATNNFNLIATIVSTAYNTLTTYRRCHSASPTSLWLQQLPTAPWAHNSHLGCRGMENIAGYLRTRILQHVAWSANVCWINLGFIRWRLDSSG